MMGDKKKVSVLIPCYNEAENIQAMAQAVTEQMQALPQYEYEILFIDNKSKDGTRDILRMICSEDKHVKAILNCKNFGQFNSPYYGMLQTNGDCVISMCCDFQDPVEMIPQFLSEWEQGYKIVCGVKKTSKENRFIRFLRTCYYKMIRKMSDVEQIEHFTGFGLYDRSFIEVLRTLDDPIPFLRGIVAELGPERKEIPYEQQLRRAGKTHNNFFSLYDAAMLSITSYTKVGLRLATFMGAILSGLSLIAGFIYLMIKLFWWDWFPAGNIPILMAVLIFGSVQLFFTGLLGEYILNINTRVIHRPLVIEEERLNF